MSSQINIKEEFGGFLDLLVEHLDATDPVLTHFGVKGMKWGVRKESKSRPELKSLGPDSVTVKTKNGETLTLSKDQPTAIHKFLSRISPSYAEGYSQGASLTLKTSDGKKVGEAQVTKLSDTELNLVWLGVKSSERGNGYATAVMGAAEEFGKQEGFKKMTLEVPGNSPDARHIYTKLGFKVIKEDLDPKDAIWGGLTEMEYVFDAKHTDTELDRIVMDDEVDDFLAHYGVMGMKWGKRKAATPQAEGYTKRQRAGDKRAYGKKNVRKINQAILDGKDHKTARNEVRADVAKKHRRNSTIAFGALVVMSFAPQILGVVVPALDRGLTNLDNKAGDIAFNAFAKDGMKKAATILADSRGLTSYETIAGEFL